jgi:proteic killer suppression protein
MQVEFRTKTLKKQYEKESQAIRVYGQMIGRRYIQRINIIKSAADIEQLQTLPVIRCHPLKENRKGDWAIKLADRARLIFTLHGEKLEIVRIEEVDKQHYGH